MRQFSKLLAIGLLGGSLILSGCGASRTVKGGGIGAGAGAAVGAGVGSQAAAKVQPLALVSVPYWEVRQVPS